MLPTYVQPRRGVWSKIIIRSVVVSVCDQRDTGPRVALIPSVSENDANLAY